MSIKNAELDWQVSTPLNRQFNDPYFSLADGLAESDYVFLQHNQLPENWKGRRKFIIAETGFGTGLNFLQTAARWVETANNNSVLTYYSVEKYPLSYEDLAKAFQNWPQFKSISDNLLKNYPDGLPGFHTIRFNSERIILVLMIGDVLPMLSNLQCRVDSWFLDGFSPAKNPAMWTKEVCKKIASLSHEKTRFATFTAAGDVRRNLQSVGFEVKKTAGFGKKREMLSGIFTGKPVKKHQKAPWFNITHASNSEVHHVVIIGGGLAGLSCAWMLSQQNIHCTLVEAGDRLASGASGNIAGIVLPRFSVDMNLESQFYVSSFFDAVSCLNILQQENNELLWHQSGVLELASEQRIQRITSLDFPEKLLQCLTRQQASNRANVKLNSGGLLFPEAGYVNPHQLCNLLAQSCDKHLAIKKNTTLSKLERGLNCWQLFNEENKLLFEAENIIFANGFDAQNVLQQKQLSLSKNRGQLTHVPTQDGIRNLKLPICSNGYIIPAINGSHVIGATYGFGDDRVLSLQDQIKNLQGIDKIFESSLELDCEELLGRASFRTTSPDHLPLVGPVPDELAYLIDYADIRHGRNPQSYPQAKYLPNVYLSTGHGSRGLVSCFASAAYLTSLICGNPIHWAENISHLVHPARFLIRGMKRNIDETGIM